MTQAFVTELDKSHGSALRRYLTARMRNAHNDSGAPTYLGHGSHLARSLVSRTARGLIGRLPCPIERYPR